MNATSHASATASARGDLVRAVPTRSAAMAAEAAGAFGDVGVFLPLALGLISVNGMNATIVFGLAGVYYLVTGWYYRVPVPVQPFKAVSAIAIAQGLAAGTIAAAALGMSAALLVLSFGRLPALLERLFLPSVVRGIQLGLGLILLQGGAQLIARDPRVGAASGLPAPLVGAPAWPAIILLVGVLLVALLQRQRRVPSLFIVIAIGLAWGVLTVASLPAVALGPVLTLPGLPTGTELITALVILVLPQLPLTLGNSVVSTTDVAREYYGARAARVRPRALLRDMGLANLAAGLAGGIPMCHGAGGMTAHYRFGARTGAALAVAGGFYLVLALLFGRAAPAFLAVFPASLLGVLVGYVGWQHLLLVRRLTRPLDLTVAGLVGVLTIVTGSLAAGFAAGLALAWVARLVGLDRRSLEPAAPTSG